MDLTTFALLAFSSLFAMIDAPGNIPFFTGLTARMDAAQKRRTLVRALLISLSVLTGFTFLGHHLLALFGLTVDAFRVAGGVIFFGIGLDMLQSKPRRWRTGLNSRRRERPSDSGVADLDGGADLDGDEDPSVTPLAIPMLAGPGSITTVMVLTSEGPAPWSGLIVVAAVALNFLLAGGILMGADLVLRRLGPTGMKILEKLMGLLVTVIAVQFVMNGVEGYVGHLSAR